jgi:hypothetical protein
MKRTILLALALVICCAGYLQAQTTSVHYLRKKNTYYKKEAGGFETISKIPYDSLHCNKCHGDSLATGIPVNDATYAPSCDDCHNFAGGTTVNSPKVCLKCHSRQNAEIAYANTDTTYKDVHYKKGFTCKNCHTAAELHEDASTTGSLLDITPNMIRCQNTGCHPTVNTSFQAHVVHGNKIACASCHLKSVFTCNNCHFETELALKGKIKRPNGQQRGFTLLVNRPGFGPGGVSQVHPAGYQSIAYQGKTFYGLTSFYSHTVTKVDAKKCQDCHDNQYVRAIKAGTVVKISSWDEPTKKLVNAKGVIPVPENWKTALTLDFADYTGRADTTYTDPTKWVFLKTGADSSHMLPAYATPMTTAQMNALAAPFTSVGETTELPETFSLGQNYPNPFNPTTNVSIALPKAVVGSLVVYDVRGAKVGVVFENQSLTAGNHVVRINASSLPSGTYLYRFTSQGFTQTRKMLLLK